MTVFIDPRRTLPYTLVGERPLEVPQDAPEPEALRIREENVRRKEKAAAFQLGILSPGNWAHYEDLAYRIEHDGDKVIGTLHLHLLRAGLRGWAWPAGPTFKGVRAPDGTVVGASDDDIGCLPPDVRVEVARAIERFNFFGDDAAGKS